ncbi:MAG: PilZ domain-containing protein [Acidobacteriota bacterium]
MSTRKPQQDLPEAEAETRKFTGQDVRCAVRFPLEIPAVLWNEAGEFPAITRNISASGVLLEIGQRLEPGERVRFSLRMPREVMHTSKDVLVHCTGRVVRCSLSQNQYLAAATIDDYQFGEQ